MMTGLANPASERIGLHARRRGVVAAGVERDGAALAAAGGAVGAGEIAHRVAHVDGRIEQARSRAAITHGARGAEPDLHQAVIAGVHGARIAAALASNHALGERQRHAGSARRLRDHAGQFGVAGEAAPRRRPRRSRREIVIRRRVTRRRAVEQNSLLTLRKTPLPRALALPIVLLPGGLLPAVLLPIMLR